MSYRVYLVIALAILGVAPFLANLADTAVPAVQPPDQQAEAAPEVRRPADDLPAALPEPRRATAQATTQLAAGAEPLLSAEPTLDATGSIPESLTGSPPPPPVRPAPAQPQAVLPPPPPSVPLSQRY